LSKSNIEAASPSTILAAYSIILFNSTSKSAVRVKSKDILFKAFNCCICFFNFFKLFSSVLSGEILIHSLQFLS